MKYHRGFTLAEILITLAIIGVVAAMTLPTLITKINDKVTQNQATVFNAKLIKGLNLTKTSGDLNNTYDSTYDFLVNGLGKNYKFAKVCDTNKIQECIPYDKIKYELNNGTEEFINIKDMKTASKLRLGGGFKDIAAFVSADGIPAIVSYDLNCTVDDGKADTSISSCFAGIYDLNGNRKPNKILNKIETINGKTVTTMADIRSFNGATLGCIGKIDDMCIAKSMKSSQIYEQMLQNGETIPTVSIWGHPPSPDMWTIAKNYCASMGLDLPSQEHLTNIANMLYETDVNENGNTVGLAWREEKRKEIFDTLNIDCSKYGGTLCGIWSSSSIGYYRFFYGECTGYGGAYHFRDRGTYYAVCVE